MANRSRHTILSRLITIGVVSLFLFNTAFQGVSYADISCLAPNRDRHGPTMEEVVTEFVRAAVRSIREMKQRGATDSMVEVAIRKWFAVNGNIATIKAEEGRFVITLLGSGKRLYIAYDGGIQDAFPATLPGSPAALLEEVLKKAAHRYRSAEELVEDLDIAASTAEKDLKLLADAGLLERRKNEEKGAYEYKVPTERELPRDRLRAAQHYLDELFDQGKPETRGNVTKFRSGEGREYLIVVLEDIVRLTSGRVRRIGDERILKAYYVVEDSLFPLLTDEASVDAIEIPDPRTVRASANVGFINFVIRFAEENNIPELREIAEIVKRGNAVFLKASSLSDPPILKSGKEGLLSYQLGTRTQEGLALELMWHEHVHLGLIALEHSKPRVWREIVNRLGRSKSEAIAELRAKVEGVEGYVEGSSKNSHELLAHLLVAPRYANEVRSIIRRVLPQHAAEPILQIKERAHPSIEAVEEAIRQAEEISARLEPRDYAAMVKEAMAIAVRPAEERRERPEPDIPGSSPASILRYATSRASKTRLRSISYLTPPGVSEDIAKRHLMLLWKAGLLEREGEGDEATYRIAQGVSPERLKTAQACLDWFFNRAGPVGRGALTAYRSGEGRDKLIAILKDIVEPSGLIKKVSEEGQEDTYVVADPPFSLFSYGVPLEQVGIVVQESSDPNYEFIEKITLCVIAAAAEQGFPGAGELMGLVARGVAIFFRASRISDPERYMPHIGASADSPALDRNREDYAKSKLWHERIHLATDRFDTVTWERIADAIDKTENTFMSNLSTRLSARAIYVKGSVIHTKETLAYALTTHRNPAATRRIIKETFPKDLAEIILDIWNRTRPSEADVNRLVRQAERLREYAEQPAYIEPTIKEMVKADIETGERRRVALHNRPTGPRALDRFLEEHADSIYQLQRDNEKAERHRVGGKITKLREVLEETMDACGTRGVLDSLGAVVLQICVIGNDEELPTFLEEGEEAVVAGGHASSRNITVIVRKKNLDDIPGIVARFFHEIRSRSSIPRVLFEQTHFGFDVEGAKARAKRMRTDFEKENKDLEEMIREYVRDRQSGRDVERKTQNISRRKLVREFANLKFDRELSPLGRDLTAPEEPGKRAILEQRGQWVETANNPQTRKEGIARLVEHIRTAVLPAYRDREIDEIAGALNADATSEFRDALSAAIMPQVLDIGSLIPLSKPQGPDGVLSELSQPEQRVFIIDERGRLVVLSDDSAELAEFMDAQEESTPVYSGDSYYMDGVQHEIGAVDTSCTPCAALMFHDLETGRTLTAHSDGLVHAVLYEALSNAPGLLGENKDNVVVYIVGSGVYYVEQTPAMDDSAWLSNAKAQLAARKRLIEKLREEGYENIVTAFPPINTNIDTFFDARTHTCSVYNSLPIRVEVHTDMGSERLVELLETKIAKTEATEPGPAAEGKPDVPTGSYYTVFDILWRYGPLTKEEILDMMRDMSPGLVLESALDKDLAMLGPGREGNNFNLVTHEANSEGVNEYRLTDEAVAMAGIIAPALRDLGAARNPRRVDEFRDWIHRQQRQFRRVIHDVSELMDSFVRNVRDLRERPESKLNPMELEVREEISEEDIERLRARTQEIAQETHIPPVYAFLRALQETQPATPQQIEDQSAITAAIDDQCPHLNVDPREIVFCSNDRLRVLMGQSERHSGRSMRLTDGRDAADFISIYRSHQTVSRGATVVRSVCSLRHELGHAGHHAGLRRIHQEEPRLANLFIALAEGWNDMGTARDAAAVCIRPDILPRLGWEVDPPTEDDLLNWVGYPAEIYLVRCVLALSLHAICPGPAFPAMQAFLNEGDHQPLMALLSEYPEAVHPLEAFLNEGDPQPLRNILGEGIFNAAAEMLNVRVPETGMAYAYTHVRTVLMAQLLILPTPQRGQGPAAAVALLDAVADVLADPGIEAGANVLLQYMGDLPASRAREIFMDLVQSGAVPARQELAARFRQSISIQAGDMEAMRFGFIPGIEGGPDVPTGSYYTVFDILWRYGPLTKEEILDMMRDMSPGLVLESALDKDLAMLGPGREGNNFGLVTHEWNKQRGANEYRLTDEAVQIAPGVAPLLRNAGAARGGERLRYALIMVEEERRTFRELTLPAQQALDIFALRARWVEEAPEDTLGPVELAMHGELKEEDIDALEERIQQIATESGISPVRACVRALQETQQATPEQLNEDYRAILDAAAAQCPDLDFDPGEIVFCSNELIRFLMNSSEHQGAASFCLVDGEDAAYVSVLHLPDEEMSPALKMVMDTHKLIHERMHKRQFSGQVRLHQNEPQMTCLHNALREGWSEVQAARVTTAIFRRPEMRLRLGEEAPPADVEILSRSNYLHEVSLVFDIQRAWPEEAEGAIEAFVTEGNPQPLRDLLGERCFEVMVEMFNMKVPETEMSYAYERTRTALINQLLEFPGEQTEQRLGAAAATLKAVGHVLCDPQPVHSDSDVNGLIMDFEEISAVSAVHIFWELAADDYIPQTTVGLSARFRHHISTAAEGILARLAEDHESELSHLDELEGRFKQRVLQEAEEMLEGLARAEDTEDEPGVAGAEGEPGPADSGESGPAPWAGSPAELLHQAAEKARHIYKSAAELVEDLGIAESTAEDDLKTLSYAGLLKRRRNEQTGKYEYKVSEELPEDKLQVVQGYLDSLFDRARPENRGNVTRFRSGKGREYLIAALRDIVGLASGKIRRVGDNRSFRIYYVIPDPLYSLLTEDEDTDAIASSAASGMTLLVDWEFIRHAISFSVANNMPEIRELVELTAGQDAIFLKASSVSGSEALPMMWRENLRIAFNRLRPGVQQEIIDRIRRSSSEAIAGLCRLVEEEKNYVRGTKKNACEAFFRLLSERRYSDEADVIVGRVFPPRLRRVIRQLRDETQPSAKTVDEVIHQAGELSSYAQGPSYAAMVKEEAGIEDEDIFGEEEEFPLPDIPESSPANILRYATSRASKTRLRSISYLTPPGVSEDIAKRHLILLWKAGLLEREGEGDNARYRVAQEVPQPKLEAAQAFLDWRFDRTHPYPEHRRSITVYRSGENREDLIEILKGIIAPSDLIRKVEGDTPFEIYIIADPLFSLIRLVAGEELTDATAVPDPQNVSFYSPYRETIVSQLFLAAEFNLSEDVDFFGVAELLGLVARGNAVFLRASAVSNPERGIPGLGQDIFDSRFVFGSRRDWVKSMVWHENLHMAFYSLDPTTWKKIADTLSKTEDEFVKKTMVDIVKGEERKIGTVSNALETLPYVLTILRRSRDVRSVIKRVFTGQLAEKIEQEWKAVEPDEGIVTEARRRAAELGRYDYHTLYMARLREIMIGVLLEDEMRKRVAAHDDESDRRAVDRFLRAHADSIFTLETDNEKAKRRRLGKRINEIRQALEETMEACGAKDVLTKLESLAVEGERKKVRLQICIIDDDEEFPIFTEPGDEEGIPVRGHASSRNITVIVRKKDLQDPTSTPDIVAAFFHEIRARSSIPRVLFEQIHFGFDVEGAKTRAKRMRTDFEKENEELEEAIRRFVRVLQSGRDIERETRNIRRRKLVREFAVLDFDRELSPLGRDLTAAEGAPFDRFLEDREMFAFTPLDFYAPGADVFEPDGEMGERYKQLADRIRQFINGLPAETRNAVFQEKLVAAGVDRCLSAMAGRGEVPFAESGGRVVAAEDYTQTITFRLPHRNLRIPNCMYRISVEFPDGVWTFFIKAVNRSERNDLIYQECASLLGFDMYPRQMRYFPRDSRSEWLIYEEIPEATLIGELPAGKLQEDEVWFVDAISRCAALNHALLVRGAIHLFTQPERAPPSVNSLDHKFMLIEENFRALLTRADMGASEEFLLQRFPAFGDLEQRADLLERFERAYFNAYMDIIDKQDGLRAVISEHDKKRVAIFEKSMREHFMMRFEVMLSSLLGWPVKERYLAAWNKVCERKSTDEINDVLGNYPNAALPEAQKALSILTSEVYGTRRKEMELSREREVLDESYRLIQWAVRELLGEPDSAALEEGVEALEEEKEQCLRMVASRREAWIEPQLEAAASIEEVEFLLRAVSQRLSVQLLEGFIDKLVLLSTVGGNLDVGLLVENVARIRNATSPPVSKRLRQSERLTRLIFDIETVATPMVNFDHKTLVLRETLGRYVKDGQRVLEIGPGCNATLSSYLAGHKRNLRILGTETNPQFVESARQAVELNGFGETIQIVESDIVSNVEGEHDVAFWNIPFVTASARRLEEMRPGLYDFMLEYATEKDEGHNLIRRFLAETPANVAADGTLIFASNTSYIPEKEIRRLIAESGLRLIRTVRLPHNPAVAFVLKFKEVMEYSRIVGGGTGGIAMDSTGSLVGVHRGRDHVNVNIVKAIYDNLDNFEVPHGKAQAFRAWYRDGGAHSGADVPRKLYLPIEGLSGGERKKTENNRILHVVRLPVANFGEMKDATGRKVTVTAHLGLRAKGRRANISEDAEGIIWLAVGEEGSPRSNVEIEVDLLQEEQEDNIISNPTQVQEMISDYRKLQLIRKNGRVNMVRMAEWLDQSSAQAQTFSHMVHKLACGKVVEICREQYLNMSGELGKIRLRMDASSEEKIPKQLEDERDELKQRLEICRLRLKCATALAKVARVIPLPITPVPKGGIALASSGSRSQVSHGCMKGEKIIFDGNIIVEVNRQDPVLTFEITAPKAERVTLTSTTSANMRWKEAGPGEDKFEVRCYEAQGFTINTQKGPITINARQLRSRKGNAGEVLIACPRDIRMAYEKGRRGATPRRFTAAKPEDQGPAGGTAEGDKGPAVGMHRGRKGRINYNVALALRESLDHLLAREKESNITADEADKFAFWFDHIRKGGEDVDPEAWIDKERLADEIVDADNGEKLYVVYLPVDNFGYTRDGRPFYGHLSQRQGILWVASGLKPGLKDAIDVALARCHEEVEYNATAKAVDVINFIRTAVVRNPKLNVPPEQRIGELASRLLTPDANAVNREALAEWRDEGSAEAQIFLHLVEQETRRIVLEDCRNEAYDAQPGAEEEKAEDMLKRAEASYAEIKDIDTPYIFEGFTGGIGQTSSGGAPQEHPIDFEQRIAEAYQGAKVAVLGGTGFVGGGFLRNFWKRIGEDASEVKALSRNPARLPRPPDGLEGKLNCVEGDHLKVKDVEKAIAGNKIIIDTAGLAWQHPGAVLPASKLGLPEEEVKRELLIEELAQNAMSAALIGTLVEGGQQLVWTPTGPRIESKQRLVWTSTNVVDIMLSRLSERNQALLLEELHQRARRYIKQARRMAKGTASDHINLIREFIRKELKKNKPAEFPIRKGKHKLSYADEFSYAYSKLLGQRILELIAHKDGKDIVVVKLSDVYGPGQPIGPKIWDQRMPARRIQRFLAVLNGIREGQYRPWEEGEHGFRKTNGKIQQVVWNDYVAPTYINDAVEILFRASVADLPPGTVVVDATTPWIPNIAMAKAVRETTKAEVEIVAEEEAAPQPQWGGEGLRFLGIDPQGLTTLDHGLHAQLSWHRTAPAILAHRGQGKVNDQIVEKLESCLTELVERSQGRLTEADVAEFRRWFAEDRKPGRDVPEGSRIGIRKLADDVVYTEDETPLRVVKLPVNELGRVDGKPFYDHLGFTGGEEEGEPIIWVAADRDEVDVELSIMHAQEEWNITSSYFEGKLSKVAATAAEARDEAEPKTQEFFIRTHVSAWRKVANICFENLISFESGAPQEDVVAALEKYYRAEQYFIEAKTQVGEPADVSPKTGIAIVSGERPLSPTQVVQTGQKYLGVVPDNVQLYILMTMLALDLSQALREQGLTNISREKIGLITSEVIIELFKGEDNQELIRLVQQETDLTLELAEGIIDNARRRVEGGTRRLDRKERLLAEALGDFISIHLGLKGYRLRDEDDELAAQVAPIAEGAVILLLNGEDEAGVISFIRDRTRLDENEVKGCITMIKAELDSRRQKVLRGAAISSSGALVGEHRGVGSVHDNIVKALYDSIEELEDKGRVHWLRAKAFRDWYDGTGPYAHKDKKRKPGEDVPEDLRVPVEQLAGGEYMDTYDGRKLHLVALPVDNFGETSEGDPITAHIGLRWGEEEGDGIVWLAVGKDGTPRANFDVELDKMHETEEEYLVSNPKDIVMLLEEVKSELARVKGVEKEEIEMRSAEEMGLIEDGKVNRDRVATWRDEASPVAQYFFHIAHKMAWDRLSLKYGAYVTALDRVIKSATGKTAETLAENRRRLAHLRDEASRLRDKTEIPEPVGVPFGRGIAMTSSGKAPAKVRYRSRDLWAGHKRALVKVMATVRGNGYFGVGTILALAEDAQAIYILTAGHNVEGKRRVEIEIEDGDELRIVDGRVLRSRWSDTKTKDLALIRVMKRNLRHPDSIAKIEIAEEDQDCDFSDWQELRLLTIEEEQGKGRKKVSEKKRALRTSARFEKDSGEEQCLELRKMAAYGQSGSPMIGLDGKLHGMVTEISFAIRCSRIREFVRKTTLGTPGVKSARVAKGKATGTSATPDGGSTTSASGSTTSASGSTTSASGSTTSASGSTTSALYDSLVGIDHLLGLLDDIEGAVKQGLTIAQRTDRPEDFDRYMQELDIIIDTSPGPTIRQKAELAKALIIVQHPGIAQLLAEEDGNVAHIESLMTLLGAGDPRIKMIATGKIGLIVPAKFIMENVGVREVLQRLAEATKDVGIAFVVVVDAATADEQRAVERLNLPLVAEVAPPEPDLVAQDRIEDLIKRLGRKGVTRREHIGLIGNPVPQDMINQTIADLENIRDIYIGVPETARGVISVYGVFHNVIGAITSSAPGQPRVFSMKPSDIEIPSPSPELQQRDYEYRKAMELLGRRA